VKGLRAPSSTLAVPGEIETLMSLKTVTLTEANFEESAWLVAITCTVPPWEDPQVPYTLHRRKSCRLEENHR